MAEMWESPPTGPEPSSVTYIRLLWQENEALRCHVRLLENTLERERKAREQLVEPTAALPEFTGIPPPKTAQPSGPGEGPGPPMARGAGGRLAEAPKRKRRGLGDILFYLALVLGLVGMLVIRATREGAPIRIAGYSGMLVLTGSMEDEIPKGSFILTKSVAPEELRVGDDITYMASATTSITHRIVDIQPQPGGTPLFQTQGVNNPAPDGVLVPAENIVGKVIYHSLTMGLVAKALSENWPLLVFLAAVWVALGWVVGRILGSDDYEGRRVRGRPTPRRRGSAAG